MVVFTQPVVVHGHVHVAFDELKEVGRGEEPLPKPAVAVSSVLVGEVVVLLM